MATFLYTWNPKKWNWSDLQEAIYHVNNHKPYDMRWSCGNTKRISLGDAFFLIRLGVEPKGIIGCGYVTSQPYLFQHWDEGQAKQGKEILGTDLLFKSLSDVPIFSIDYLKKNYPHYNWTPQAGGLSIPDKVAYELFSFLQHSQFAFESLKHEEIRNYSEGKIREITINTYDRNPIARQVCIEHHGYDCAVCGFNFGQVYGSFGQNYIEVHHLKQLADIGEEYQIKPIEDLRPVCANCHRMLHKERPPLGIEDLKAKLSK
jgi:5-methylcytosine-specific restriction protein A